MSSLNSISLQGRLTKDPDYRESQGGTGFCSFTLAVDDGYRDKDGQWQDKASFIDCKVIGKSALSFANHHKKGGLALISGKLKQETWKDKETGGNRSKVVVVAMSWHFCQSSKNEQGEAPQGQAPAAQQGFDSMQQNQPPASPGFTDDCPF